MYRSHLGGITMNEPTYQELKDKLALLEAKEARKAVGGIRMGNKGGVSVYGIQKFPVTLYAEGWKALLDRKEEILAFIEANNSVLKHKAPKAEVTPAATV
jgi:hypothetical protein